MSQRRPDDAAPSLTSPSQKKRSTTSSTTTSSTPPDTTGQSATGIAASITTATITTAAAAAITTTTTTTAITTPPTAAAAPATNHKTTPPARPPTTGSPNSSGNNSNSNSNSNNNNNNNNSVRRDRDRDRDKVPPPSRPPQQSQQTAAAAAARPLLAQHTRAASRSGNLIHNNPPPSRHRQRASVSQSTAATPTTTSTSTSTSTSTPSSSSSTPTSTPTTISSSSSRPRNSSPASPRVVIIQPPSAPAAASARAHRRHTSVAQHKKPDSTALQPRPATSHTEPPPPPPPPPPPADVSAKSRQPARFSSNGIATSAGPPPSLAYRRNIAMDNRFSPRDTRGMAGATADRSSADSSGSTVSHFSRSGSRKEGREGRERGSSFSSKRSSLRTETRTNGYDSGEYEQRGGTIRGLEDLQNGGVSIEAGELDGGELGGEDVFLNLARSNSVHTENSAYRAERRRSRLTQLAQHRNSLPADTFSASPLRATQTHSAANRTLTNSPAPILHDGAWHPGRASTPRDRRMSAASLADGPEEHKSLTPRASFSRPLSMLRRERSPASATHTRSYSMADPPARTRSSLANPRQLHTRDGTSQPITTDDEDTAADPITPTRADDPSKEDSSSVSTTAPSTVWDELDDLKSRIRRLELTGRIPASGVGSIGGSLGTVGTNASNSSGDRPRTATTTVTTISSSPRNNNTNSGVSPANSTGGGSSNSHPLLHAALAKSKSIVLPEVFKYLEAAAHDAMSLADTVGGTGSPGGPPASGSMVSDRQVRRKAESVCRSLTELCLALSENRGLQPAPNFSMHLSQHYGGRPVSRDVMAGGTIRERDRSESILARELGLGREREREGILGRDRIESVIAGREVSFGRESSFGRDGSFGSSFGRDRTDSMLGGRESLLNREGSFGRDRTESVLGNREGMLTRESSFGRDSVTGDRLASRLTSRFGERKGSIASISTTAGFLQSSPRRELTEKLPSPSSPSQTGHLRSRNSMLLKSRPIFDDDEDPESYRSPSRAATEVMGHRQLRDCSAGTHVLTPSTSGALPPRRQYVIAHGTPSGNGLPSPVLHQRRFFSNGSERSGDTSGTTSLNSSFGEGLPVVPDQEYARFRAGSVRTPGTRRLGRGLRESVDLDSGAQGGSLGRTPMVGGERGMRR